VSFGKAADARKGFFEIAPEHQRRAIAVGLRQFVAGRYVFDPASQFEVLEPGRLGDVEVIYRMKVVVEAGLGDLFRHQSAAVLQPAVDEQDIQARLCKVRAQNQSVLAGTDDDAVILPIKSRSHNAPPDYLPVPLSPAACLAAGSPAACRIATNAKVMAAPIVPPNPG